MDRDEYELLIRSALPNDGEGIVVLGPGDHLVVNLGPGVTASEIGGLRTTLNERFPAVCDRILLIAGAESLAVLPGQQTYDEYRADVSEDADV